MDKEKGTRHMKKKDIKADVEIPLDVAMSLLRHDELAKLKRYVFAYLATYKGNK